MSNCWIETASGRRFDLLAPDPQTIDIMDIAQALSNLCRFVGHVPFYSVAEHSLMVSRTVPVEDALWGLLHDAAEAYIGDIPSPLKAILGNAIALETGILRAVAQRFGLPWPMPATVKTADRAVLLAEKRDLKPGGIEWGNPGEALEERVVPCYPQLNVLRRLFLWRFRELCPLDFIWDGKDRR